MKRLREVINAQRHLWEQFRPTTLIPEMYLALGRILE